VQNNPAMQLTTDAFEADEIDEHGGGTAIQTMLEKHDTP